MWYTFVLSIHFNSSQVGRIIDVRIKFTDIAFSHDFAKVNTLNGFYVSFYMSKINICVPWKLTILVVAEGTKHQAYANDSNVKLLSLVSISRKILYKLIRLYLTGFEKQDRCILICVQLKVQWWNLFCNTIVWFWLNSVDHMPYLHSLNCKSTKEIDSLVFTFQLLPLCSQTK